MNKVEQHKGQEYKIAVTLNSSTDQKSGAKLHRVIASFKGKNVFDSHCPTEDLTVYIETAEKVCKDQIEVFCVKHEDAATVARDLLTKLGFK